MSSPCRTPPCASLIQAKSAAALLVCRRPLLPDQAAGAPPCRPCSFCPKLSQDAAFWILAGGLTSLTKLLEPPPEEEEAAVDAIPRSLTMPMKQMVSMARELRVGGVGGMGAGSLILWSASPACTLNRLSVLSYIMQLMCGCGWLALTTTLAQLCVVVRNGCRLLSE